ncbi:Ger(x)C family spore germination protein [Bacillus thuringiensis]|nr:Ger(x)C family spore germination protein [Bacillus thuringiensis]
MKKTLVIIIMVIFLTGCWDQKELNEISINLALGIDKIGDQYLISYQIVNPGEVGVSKGGNGRAPVILAQVKAKDISTALRKITTVIPRRLYLGHLRMLIINEQIAKEGLSKILDFFLRSNTVRSDFYIAIAKNTKAANVLKVLTPLEKIPSNQMFSSLKVSHELWAPTITITITELSDKLMTPGIHPVITGITVKGKVAQGEKNENVQSSDPKAIVQFVQNAVFKNDRLIGWLNPNQNKGYNYITNNVHNTIGTIPCLKGGHFNIEVIKSKTKIKGIVKNNNPKIKISTNLKATISEVQCSHLNLEDPKTISKLEKNTEKKLKELIESSLSVAQEKYKIDIFGFGEEIHRTDYKYWRKVKKNWDKQFEFLPVTVTTNVKIEHTNTSKNSILNKTSE